MEVSGHSAPFLSVKEQQPELGCYKAILRNIVEEVNKREEPPFGRLFAKIVEVSGIEPESESGYESGSTTRSQRYL